MQIITRSSVTLALKAKAMHSQTMHAIARRPLWVRAGAGLLATILFLTNTVYPWISLLPAPPIVVAQEVSQVATTSAEATPAASVATPAPTPLDPLDNLDSLLLPSSPSAEIVLPEETPETTPSASIAPTPEPTPETQSSTPSATPNTSESLPNNSTDLRVNESTDLPVAQSTDSQVNGSTDIALPPLLSPFSIRLSYPFSGTYPVSYNFGEISSNRYVRLMQRLFEVEAHDGIDFALSEGTTILAADTGEVVSAGEGLYGVTVVIKHSWGNSYYGHLSQTSVTTGEHVTTGQAIGLSGSTGISTGPHLHFGIRPNRFDSNNGFRGLIDPAPYLNRSFEKSNAVPRRQKKSVFSLRDNTVSQNHPELNLVLNAPYDRETTLLLKTPTGAETSLSDTLDASLPPGPIGTVLSIALPPSTLTEPGIYELTLINPDGTYDTHAFSWGVLAINPHKSQYLPNELAQLDLAVLDDHGQMVCDADLSLTITSPLGNTFTLQTADQSITANVDSCQLKGYTLIPDFTTTYQTAEPGTYLLHLTATTPNGTRSLTDHFEVKTELPFSIARQTATRIYPREPYPVTLNIQAYTDYQGTVTELVPSNFLIQNQSGGATLHPLTTTTSELRWEVNFEAGQAYQLSYTYDAPDVSPDFYTLGPLSIGSVFSENRRWQLAIDATLTHVGSVEGDGTDNSGGWTEIADLYGNDTRDANLSVSWKVMGATPDSTVPVNAAISSAYGGVTLAHVWRNADTTNPIDVTTTTATGTNAATFDSPSITPTTTGAVVLSIGLSTAAASAGDTSITAPTGYTNQVDHNGNGTTHSVQAGIASKAWTSGAENPAAWTGITTSTSDSWAAASVALRPSGTLTYVGSVENAGTTAYSLDLSSLSLQAGDLVILVNGWSYTTNGDPGVALFSLDLSSLSLQEGDLVIAACGWSHTTDGNPGVYTSGYTEIADLYGNDTRDANLSVSWKVMGATPDSTVVCVTSGYQDNVYGSAGLAHVWRNADTTNPIDVTTTTATGTNAATFDSPSITPTTTGAVVLSIGLSTAAASAGDTSITAPTGYTNQVDHNGNGTTHSVQSGIASKAWTSGAENPAAWTNITTSTSDSWAAASVALRPLTNATISISGTASSNDGATVRLALDNTLQPNTTTISSGSWSFASINVTGDPIITVWVDGVADSSEATAVTKWTGGNITGLTLTPNTLSLGSNQNANLTLTNLNLYDCSDDEDIMHQAASSHLKVTGDNCALSTTNSYTSPTLSLPTGDTLSVATSETVSTHHLDLAGTLSSTGNATYNVSGNWTNTGTFTEGTSTVNLNGGDSTTQVVSGNTSFYNLSATTTSNALGRALRFTAGTTTTITGTWTASGASGKVLTLESSTTSAWSINPTTASVTYVSVSYSTNTGVDFCATYSTDGGNNTNWNITTLGSCPVPADLGNSFQRKTWHDGSRYWRSYQNTTANRLEFQYSSDGVSWTENTNARVNIDTSDFATIGNSTEAYLTYPTQSVTNTDTLVTNGLVGYWKMNEASWSGSAGEVLDASGNSFNGTRTGNATTTTGRLENGGIFDGSGDYVTVADNASLRPGSGSWTISTWLKADDFDQNTTPVFKFSGSVGWGLGVTGDVDGGSTGRKIIAVMQESGSNFRNTITNSDVTDANWHHIAAVWNTSTDSVTIYVDGASVATTTDYGGSWPNMTNTDPLTIGTSSVVNDYSGLIDDLRLYNRAVTETEIAVLAKPGYDIETRSAVSYPSTSWSWSTEVVTLNGSSSTDSYRYPVVTQDTSSYVWLAASNLSGSNYNWMTIRSSSASSLAGWGSPATLDTTTSSNQYGLLLPRLSGALQSVWIDGTAIESKNYSGSWDGSPTSVGTGNSGLTTTLAGLADSSGDTHIIYINGSGGVNYQKYTSSWSSSITLDSTSGSTYPTLSLDTDSDSLFAIWINNNDLFYVQGSSPYGASDWDSSPTTWQNTGTNTSLSSSYSASGEFFAQWEDDNTIEWDKLSFSNTAPNSPTSLAQMTTSDVSLSTGDWHNSTSIKFSATATDPDNPDTLQLCIEIDQLGTGFSNTEDSCGSGASYSGSGITLSHTIVVTDAQEYHWQARVKDAGGLYSSWVSYDVNAESARDIGVDTTAPTGGTVYDGESVGVDTTFATSSLSSLSANWDGVNTNVSGLLRYDYSIGTTAGATDIKTWTDNGTSTSVTATGLTLQTSQMYYVNVRAVDNAGNTQTPISSNGQLVSPSLSFAITPATTTFNNLGAGNSYADTQTTTLTTSTNAYNGYVIRAFTTDLLKSVGGTHQISNFSAGSYASPASWSGSETGFGYTSSDTNVQGSNKFGGGTLYAPFSQTGPGDIVADHTSTVTGTSISNESFNITYKVKVPASQAATNYTSTVVYTATAQY